MDAKGDDDAAAATGGGERRRGEPSERLVRLVLNRSSRLAEGKGKLEGSGDGPMGEAVHGAILRRCSRTFASPRRCFSDDRGNG